MIPEEDPVGVEANIREVATHAAASYAGITVEIKRLLLARSLSGNKPLVDALQNHGAAVFGEPTPNSGTPLYADRHRCARAPCCKAMPSGPTSMCC